MDDMEMDPASPFVHLDRNESAFWYSYMKVLLRVRYEMNRQLRDATGLSIADYDVLVALTSEPNALMRISDLSVRLGWERSRLSHHLKRMRDRNLLQAQRFGDDQRAAAVTLTPIGRAALADATPGHVAFIRSAFLEVLSPAELESMSVAFDKVYDALIAHGTLPRPSDHP